MDTVESLVPQSSRPAVVKRSAKQILKKTCASGSNKNGYVLDPMARFVAKAHALGKKGRASAAARKRREDPNANRSGPAINVSTKGKKNENR